MIYFNGKALETIAPVCVDDVNVSSVRLNVNARQQPVRYGSDFVRITGANRIITITFALLTNDRTIRQRQLMEITAWAEIGNVHQLVLPDYPNMYLECACTEAPSPSVKQWWDNKLRLVFSTYENPFFTSIHEKSAACGTAFYVSGSAPEGALMRIENTFASSASNVAYSDGVHTMTFSAIPAGEMVIDLNRQTAAVGSTSIMSAYTFDSSFIIPAPGSMTITGTGTVKWKERWI